MAIDEIYVKLNGEMVCLRRAVDHEGEVLERRTTQTYDKDAALTFMKKAVKRHISLDAITVFRFRRMNSLQKFAFVHASLHNNFNLERHLFERTTYKVRRSAAPAERQLVAN